MTPFPVIRRKEEEKYFLDPATIKQFEFPRIEDQPSVDLSVVIPAYNEEERCEFFNVNHDLVFHITLFLVPSMLTECMEFLENEWKGSFEVILVSDGSEDKTVELGLKYSKKYTSAKFRVLDLIENRGKGGAVRLGMLSTRGKFSLFADADGATDFKDFGKLYDLIVEMTGNDFNKEAIVIGSRAHLEQDSIATRSLFRTILMHGFHFLVWLLTVKSVKDTQCGFKLLSRSAIQRLFTIMHVERWAFDVELLYLAEKMKIPIKEVAVNWQEIAGSKLTPLWASLQMGRDLFLIWFRYTFGIWKVYKNHHSF